MLKAISREPAHRYPTAVALGDDLQRFLDDRPILARRVAPLERAVPLVSAQPDAGGPGSCGDRLAGLGGRGRLVGLRQYHSRLKE